MDGSSLCSSSSFARMRCAAPAVWAARCASCVQTFLQVRHRFATSRCAGPQCCPSLSPKFPELEKSE